MSASQLWLALLHLTCSDDCTVSRGLKSDGRIKVESFASVLFFDCVQSHLLVRCTTLPSFVTSIHPKIFAPEKLSFNETSREKNSHLHLMRVTCMVCVLSLVESADQIRRASQRTTDSHFLVYSFIQFHPVPYSAMNPRFQDGSFQTAADMLRNQQREFVEPLMQQLAANLGDTLAGSISFAVDKQFRPHRIVT